MTKKANDYWIKRAHERSRADIRACDEVIKSINMSFYNSLKQIEKEIATLFYRYSEDNELDYDLAIKLLAGNEYKSFRMELEEYLGLIESPEILLELNTLSAKSRISHLEESFFHIQKQIDKVYLHQSEVMQELMKDSVQKNYYKSIFDVGKVVAGDAAIKEFHKLTIDEIVKEFERPWSGKNFSERLWKNRTKLKDALEEEIIKMAVSGANPEQAADTIAKKMDVAKRTAATLVHTEQAYFSGFGSLKAYREMGVDKYIYIATLDMKTSDICRDLDHEVFDVSQAQAGVNYPPMHPRCRSTTAPYTGELEGTRLARDKDGNSVRVDKSLSYKDWYEKYVASAPEYLKEEKKWKNRYSDKKLHEKYRKIYGKDIPKSFEDFQKLKYNNSKELEDIKFRHKLKESVFPSEKSLSGHFEKHRGKLGIDSKDEYLKQAQELLGKKESENISRYRTKNGRVVAYDNINNRIVIYSDGKIRSYMSPEKGVDYYKEQYEKDVNG
ncbi:minor capsid protein [Peptostreptococcus sp.]|uniref:minor capsid protein n=1 Tax=Peptostreptococcus sp. TaxID=1262 RepID=UPI001D306348|nr:minor capsid protein [Peptostreptococcus sp.]MBS5595676.1 minor capsid protein [Peptostreptococcus sp.]